MNNEILAVNNLTILMKDRFLVRGVSFSMQKGECYALIGDDKSGKTSLLKAISGSLPISSGSIFVNGKNIVQDKNVLSDVSICLDPPVFFKYQTVYENLSYLTMLNNGKSNKEKIIKILNKFNLGHRIKTRVLFLSYYEKKLLSLALAVLTEPKLLLLDEPFKSMPQTLAAEIKGYIDDIKNLGTTVIISAKDIESVEYNCDKMIFIERRTIKNIIDKSVSQSFVSKQTFAYVVVKHPHVVAKLLKNTYDIKVKLIARRVLFEANEAGFTQILRLITSHKEKIYKAGYLTQKAEKIFAELTSYYKEDEA